METCPDCDLPELDCQCVEIENFEDGEIDFDGTCEYCGEVGEFCECESLESFDF